MTRVGFAITATNEAWLGGLNYFRNLIGAVHATPECGLEPVIFAGAADDPKVFRDFASVTIVRTPLLDRFKPAWALRKSAQKVLGRDALLERLLRRHDVKMLSHSGFLGARAGMPTLGWIPDFQHRHLPQFFSEAERVRRDRLFEDTSRECTRVVVSSRDAERDFLGLYPQRKGKVDVLRFVVEAPRAAAEPSIDDVLRKYSISAPYFLLPNQFWEHKNHRVVVAALKLLKQRGCDARVVCTGNTADLKQAGYFPSLMAEVEASGLQNQFKVLGVIPYAELVVLIKNALALVNPSLFEGWSTTVEEAKSLGKRIVLSDIGVHREQEPPGGFYFAPDNAEQLAELLSTLWKTPEDAALAERAREQLPARRRAFALAYAAIVKKTVES